MERYRDAAKTAFETIEHLLEPHFSLGGCLQRLEIEILPNLLVPTGQELMVQRDGHCIAIPKKLLALAFLHARLEFFDLRDHDSLSPDAIERSKRLSYVMLLYDSEIATATNFRREYLDEEEWPGQEYTARMTEIENELRLLDSLLTSQLPRHTKSPNLWAYRLWLLQSYEDSVDHVTRHIHIMEYRWPVLTNKKRNMTDVWTRFTCAELELIHEAGEKHSRNYYAFDYARKLVDFLLTHIQEYIRVCEEFKSKSDSDNGDDSADIDAIEIVLGHAIRSHHDWCLQHPSDCSGWSFLRFLLCKPGACSSPDIGMNTVTKTLRRAVNLFWSGAAVWSFIKTTVGSDDFLDPAQRKKLLEILQAIATDPKSRARGPSEQALIKAASETIAWIKANWSDKVDWPLALILQSQPRYQGVQAPL